MLVAVELAIAISVLGAKLWPFWPCQTVIVDVVVPATTALSKSAGLLVNVLAAVALFFSSRLIFPIGIGTYVSLA